jgi:ribosomal subunit interface protein
MKINIQSGKQEVYKGVEVLVEEKLAYLAGKYEWIINADVFFKKEKETHGKGHICEIKLSLPGPLVFASSDKDSFESAVAETVNDLDKQLRKRKDTMSKH